MRVSQATAITLISFFLFFYDSTRWRSSIPLPIKIIYLWRTSEIMKTKKLDKLGEISRLPVTTPTPDPVKLQAYKLPFARFRTPHTLNTGETAYISGCHCEPNEVQCSGPSGRRDPSFPFLSVAGVEPLFLMNFMRVEKGRVV